MILNAVRTARRLTVEALVRAFDRLLPGEPTEREIRDAWHHELSAVEAFLPEGWYLPPPHGMIVVAGTPPEFERTKFPSFRVEESWSSPASRLTESSVLYAYASPVHRGSGIIGDIGVTLYRGHDSAVRDHIKGAWVVTQEIAGTVQPGTRVCDVYDMAIKTIAGAGLRNLVYSSSDATQTNIGHSIPWAAEAASDDQLKVIASEDPIAIARMVSAARVFVNAANPMVIGEGTALTIEPRVSSFGLPSASFHVAVVVEAGEACLITEFEPLLELFGMDYLT